MQKFSKVLNQFWVYDRLGFTKMVVFGPIYDNFLFRKRYFMKRHDFVTNNFIPNLFFQILN